MNDQELLTSICNTLQPLNFWLSEYDLSGGVKMDTFDGLDDLLRTMNDPWKEFLDESVETARRNLLESIAIFLDIFSICVYPNGEYYITGALQIEGAPPDAWKEYRAKMKELNDKATAVWKSYHDLVRVARKRGMQETGEEIHVRLDKELKEAVTVILDEIDLDIQTAIRLFFKAVAREKGIPFDLKTVSEEKMDGVVTDQGS